ncbi:carboxymuconolactone decarboxylase family protein [Euzebya pacifica]|uniref:carboxymuconolactone decarboxylase family protein n=1 Tax=Euzebya pacifica TaxID=1608957 RepID=UPI0030F8429A
MARLEPLGDEELRELTGVLTTLQGTIGFVPNSARTLGRWPTLAVGFQGLAAAMREAVDDLPTGLANLVHLVASQAAGCTYCQAHGAVTTVAHGVPEAKLADVWSFETSTWFSEAERAALRLAAAAALSPSEATDAHFADLRRHYDDEQVVRIVGVIAISGFMNRWNATVATTLEDTPKAATEARLGGSGWQLGVHG